MRAVAVAWAAATLYGVAAQSPTTSPAATVATDFSAAPLAGLTAAMPAIHWLRSTMNDVAANTPEVPLSPLAAVALDDDTILLLGEMVSFSNPNITYLPTVMRGVFFYLYLILDLFSRKVVGWAVYEVESMDLSSELLDASIKAEGADPKKRVVHADNGGPMKGSTMLATLQRLGVVASFSRPSVSDDNPFAEALFRTLKYRPGYPSKPFATIESARAWVLGFVAWYNGEHLHSGIRYVTPDDRHAGRDKAILAQRHELYTQAKERTPRRWSRSTRNWSPIGAVYLNPVKQENRVQPIATPVA